MAGALQKCGHLDFKRPQHLSGDGDVYGLLMSEDQYKSEMLNLKVADGMLLLTKEYVDRMFNPEREVKLTAAPHNIFIVVDPGDGGNSHLAFSGFVLIQNILVVILSVLSCFFRSVASLFHEKRFSMHRIELRPCL
jgi:hypothetical protein